MARTRMTIEEALAHGHSMALIDRRTGKRIPRRAEWEQFPRWRRWRDLLLGWDPPKHLNRWDGVPPRDRPFV